ncbi:nucleotidyltransferase domain-containing protein [Kitasatospora sp. NPDC001159]
MKRDRATELVQAMLTRLDCGERPLDLVEEVYLFGSYVRGALDPHDVDVAVQHAVDEAFARHQVSAMLAGRDPYASMKKALVGSTRGLSLQFQQRDDLVADGIELTLLWRRGDTLAEAERRLAAMKPDPKAGSAPRDHMLPVFEGLERWLPRPRGSISSACTLPEPSRSLPSLWTTPYPPAEPLCGGSSSGGATIAPCAAPPRHRWPTWRLSAASPSTKLNCMASPQGETLRRCAVS